MCLEDLRLGRGRFIKRPLVATGGAAVTLPADASRVAVIVTFTGMSYFDAAGTGARADIGQIRFSASISDPLDMDFSSGTNVFVMGIEQYGNVIAGPITATVFNQSGNAILSLVSICTEVNAPPLGTYKP